MVFGYDDCSDYEGWAKPRGHGRYAPRKDRTMPQKVSQGHTLKFDAPRENGPVRIIREGKLDARTTDPEKTGRPNREDKKVPRSS